MNYKIVVDSSSDLLEMEGVDLASAPLKITAGMKEFVDNAELDVNGMVEYLKTFTERTSTSCPSAGEWIEAFGDAERVFCITITKNLSGSYNAALVAKGEYEAEHPERKVCVLDSLSTGPEMVLMVEKIRELMAQGVDFDTVGEMLVQYAEDTQMVFALGSLNNLARNGRVNPAVAKVCGVLGIRIVGKVTDGRLDPQAKCRGEKRSIQEMIKLMGEMGYNGGKIRICHVVNPEGAESMAKLLLEKWPGADLVIRPARGLVSYYAELNGLLMAFETK